MNKSVRLIDEPQIGNLHECVGAKCQKKKYFGGFVFVRLLNVDPYVFRSSVKKVNYV